MKLVIYYMLADSTYKINSRYNIMW